MIRLIVALHPPATVRTALLALMGGIAGARWQSDAQLHLTLAFLGEVDEDMAMRVVAALAAIDSAAIDVSLSGIGTFGTPDRPKALWIGAQPSDALAALAAKVEQACRRAGAPLERRAFVPHVTLARLRDTAPTELAHYLGLHPIVRPISFTARRVALMSSRDSVGGGPYVLEAAYPLGPSYPNRLSREMRR